jgi:hypothetical protein
METVFEPTESFECFTWLFVKILVFLHMTPFSLADTPCTPTMQSNLPHPASECIRRNVWTFYRKAVVTAEGT